MSRSIYVMRSANGNLTELFLRREICTFDTIHAGRAIRVTLIKLFITSTQFHHMTWNPTKRVSCNSGSRRSRVHTRSMQWPLKSFHGIGEPHSAVLTMRVVTVQRIVTLPAPNINCLSCRTGVIFLINRPLRAQKDTCNLCKVCLQRM